MMVLYDKIPFSGTNLKCGPEIWLKSDVEKDFKDILETNIAAIKIKNTNSSSRDVQHAFCNVFGPRDRNCTSFRN